MGAEETRVERFPEAERRRFDAREIDEHVLFPGEGVTIEHMTDETPMIVGAGAEQFVVHQRVDGEGLAIFHRLEDGVGPEHTLSASHEIGFGREINNPEGSYGAAMSRYHFSVRALGPESFELRDLGSSNGTLMRQFHAEQAPE